VQIFAYADDTAIISRSPKSLQDATIELDRAARRIGLEINQAKTKYMICGTKKKYTRNVFKVKHMTFGNVNSFVYLGTLITTDNNTSPIVTYASETWVLKEAIIQKLLVFERKILRRIFGPKKENQIWRVKTNQELDKLIKHKNIINYIKAQRLSWFGHVQKMPDTRTVKKILNWKPLTKRSQGRPKYR